MTVKELKALVDVAIAWGMEDAPILINDGRDGESQWLKVTIVADRKEDKTPILRVVQ